MRRHPSRLSIIILILFVASLSLAACTRQHEPIDGFWSYAWGTTYDSILADSADIQFRLGGEDFALERNAVRMTFRDVQYGMGYDQVVLDFTTEGLLWHGHARTRIDGDGRLDSVLASLHNHYGDDTGDRVIQREQGYLTYWYTRTWFDRDFFADSIAPRIDPGTVQALDLMYGGCPTDCAIYSVRLLANGAAYLWAIRGPDNLGGFRGSIDSATFSQLAVEATRPGYLALAGLYEYDQTNLPTAGIRADFGTFEKLTESLDGCGPAVLEDFIARVDLATQNIEWEQIVSWDTIRVFDQYYVDLDSLQAIGSALGR